MTHTDRLERTHIYGVPAGTGGRIRLGFEALAALSLVVTGVWFLAAGWGEFTNAAAIAVFAVAGFCGAVVVLPLGVTGRHGLAAVAALVSIVTPTGFAYLPNLLMAAVAIIEIRLAATDRTPNAA